MAPKMMAGMIMLGLVTGATGVIQCKDVNEGQIPNDHMCYKKCIIKAEQKGFTCTEEENQVQYLYKFSESGGATSAACWCHLSTGEFCKGTPEEIDANQYCYDRKYKPGDGKTCQQVDSSLLVGSRTCAMGNEGAGGTVGSDAQAKVLATFSAATLLGAAALFFRSA